MDTSPVATPSLVVIETEAVFRDLAQPWNDLSKRCNGSVFLRHEWFDAAWAWRKDNAKLFILVARAGDRTVGIFPLVKVGTRRGFPRLRCLEFLTVPDTQICDVMVDPDYRDIIAAAFCKLLVDRRSEWDQLTLSYLAEGSVAIQDFKRALEKQQYPVRLNHQGPNLFVKLDTSWNDFYGTRSRSLKKANNLAANRLKKSGNIDIQWVSRESTDDAATENALNEAIDISRRSWKQSTGNSLDHAGPMRFIRTLTAHASRHGWLSLWLLSLDKKTLAMEYQLLDQGNVYALRADFDAACEEISPGSHLMRTLLETLFDRGLHCYYMGPGENAYKTRWTEECEQLYRLVVYGSTWRGTISRAMDEVIKPLLRTIRAKLARNPTP